LACRSGTILGGHSVRKLSTLGLCIATLAAMAQPAFAQSVTLFPAQVSAANIEALFGATGTDEVTDIPLPGITGAAHLQSRVIRAAAGSRAEGRFAYQYRVDLTSAVAFIDFSCLLNLTVKFGPVEKLPYAPGVILRDVYEIQQGVPANQVGFSSAVQTGEFVTFTFQRPICAGDGITPGATSFAFGLASRDAPDRGVTVQMDALGIDDLRVKSSGPIGPLH
jgi:hypothetical protein